MKISTLMLIGFLTSAGYADDATTNIWLQVKARAEQSEDGKALWRELKKLSPSELLICGEQFCAAEAERDTDGTGTAITANVILSYYAEKTSYDDTAEAIGHILARSDTPAWINEAVMWIENNDHYLHVSDSGMHQIAAGILSSLHNSNRLTSSQEAVLDAVREDTLILSLTDDDFYTILGACRSLGQDLTTSHRIQTLAQQYVIYAEEGERERAAWKQTVNERRNTEE